MSNTTTLEPTRIQVDIPGAAVEIIHAPGEGVFVHGVDAPVAQLIALREALTSLLYPIIVDTSEE